MSELLSGSDGIQEEVVEYSSTRRSKTNLDLQLKQVRLPKK